MERETNKQNFLMQEEELYEQILTSGTPQEAEEAMDELCEITDDRAFQKIERCVLIAGDFDVDYDIRLAVINGTTKNLFPILNQKIREGTKITPRQVSRLGNSLREILRKNNLENNFKAFVTQAFMETSVLNMMVTKDGERNF